MEKVRKLGKRNRFLIWFLLPLLTLCFSMYIMTYASKSVITLGVACIYILFVLVCYLQHRRYIDVSAEYLCDGLIDITEGNKCIDIVPLYRLSRVHQEINQRARKFQKYGIIIELIILVLECVLLVWYKYSSLDILEQVLRVLIIIGLTVCATVLEVQLIFDNNLPTIKPINTILNSDAVVALEKSFPKSIYIYQKDEKEDEKE